LIANAAYAVLDAEQLRKTEQTIKRAGGLARAIPADVSRLESVEELKKEVEQRIGLVSILVNAAGIFGPIQLINDGDPKRWIETIAVNLFGPYFTCHAFVGGMIQNGWGRIINFTSAARAPSPARSTAPTHEQSSSQSVHPTPRRRARRDRRDRECSSPGRCENGNVVCDSRGSRTDGT
jgi:NAD(P)-dependent dehydrogenase (short-subunit alcohol dehydrogenase family)